MPWRGPEYPGELPTLGWLVLDWIAAELAAPDGGGSGEPFLLTREQAQFVLDFYAVNPVTMRRIYRRAVLSRSKGWGKSPLLAAIAAAEALAEVVPDGWTAAGEPVGRAWSSLRTPLVQLAAVSEDQTRNAWDPLLEMLREGPAVDDYRGLEVLDTFVNLPGSGRIEPVTSSAPSREGNRPIFCSLDQTESWYASNGGVRMAATLRRNLGKTGGSSIESPNAFVPGENSVAEASAIYAARIREGRGRVRDAGLLYDHREAPARTDFSRRTSLRAGLAWAYGDSADLGPGGCVIHDPPCAQRGHVDLDRIIAEVWDPDTDPQDARRYYGNQVTHASDSWMSAPEWAQVADPRKIVAPDEVITVGFDGSRRRSRAVTDATALIGCRVSDGHVFEIRIWEQPDGPEGRDWRVPQLEVDAEVATTFARWTVVGFFADPSKWETNVARWEAKYGQRLHPKVRASRNHPMSWPKNRPTVVVPALKRLHDAVLGEQCTQDGSSGLTRHVLNSRRRPTRSGLLIGKEYPESPKKIDGTYAAMLAWEARLAAVAAGADRPRSKLLRTS